MAPTTALFGRRALRDAVATLARRHRARARAASGVAAPSVDGDAGGGADARAASGSASGSGRGAAAIERWSADLMEDDEELDMLLATAGSPEVVSRPGPKLRPLSSEATAFGDAPDRIFESTDERRAKIKLALQSLYARRRQLRRNEHAREPRPALSEEDVQMRKQREAENLALEREVARYKEFARKTFAAGIGAQLPVVQKLLASFYVPLVEALREEHEKIKGNVPGVDRRVYGHYLALLEPEKLTVLTLHATLSTLMKGDSSIDSWTFIRGETTSAGSAKFITVADQVGSAVQAEVNLGRMRAAEKAAKEAFRRSRMVNTEENRQEVDALTEHRLNAVLDTTKMTTIKSVSKHAKQALENAEWGREIRLKVGTVLLTALMNTAKIGVPNETGGVLTLPAFYHDYKEAGYGMLHWHDSIYRFINTETMTRAALVPVRHFPMVVPPRDWVRYNKGGYLRADTLFMRGKYSNEGPSRAQIAALEEKALEAEAAGEPVQYQPVLDALSALGRTPWQVNTDVLPIVEEVWARGGGIAEVPLRAELQLPRWPGGSYTLRSDKRRLQLLASGLPGKGEVVDFLQSIRKTKKLNMELHSQRCDFLIKLQVAREMKNEKKIYFPHNLDFRGRAYTMHVHLNHIGSDLCRGLLRFEEKKPLGERGLRWMHIQCATLFGNGADKLPMDERVQFIKDHIDEVRASAQDPLASDAWWQDAEEPWQCLATCIELDKALELADPTEFESNLPVHQDGSCNGLQHYAALGRDLHGGEAVNLVPADRGADVYTGISNVLKRIVAEDMKLIDSADEDDVATAKLAMALAQHIDRKLVKQTVMTSVYGVTFIGARAQIYSRLREREAMEDNELLRYRVANYAAKRTLDALNNMFTNARDVMGWLTQCATIATSAGEPVRWTTPLGLPVVQPYHRQSKKRVRTILQSFSLKSDGDGEPVMKVKQRSAFPPNYIHSIDSSHMMKTAVACVDAGLTFAGVHDSFWTHARDVDEMSAILRDKFIEVHNEPLLDNLYQELRATYPDVADDFPPPPAPGDLSLDVVKESVYFFS